MAYTVPKIDDYSEASVDRALSEARSALTVEADTLRQDFASAAIPHVEKSNRFKSFRDRWVARKNGLLANMGELWLKAAPPAKKRDVGRAFNEMAAITQTVIESLEKDLGQSFFLAPDQSEKISERVDITLPGI